jgi:TPR repeat protein
MAEEVLSKTMPRPFAGTAKHPIKDMPRLSTTLPSCTKNGQGVKQDYAEAIRLYRKAANQGDAHAQSILGVMNCNGQGVKQDYAEAARLYRKAADQGHANAQLNLGNMYNNGYEVKQDYAEAVRWYRKAADQGDADAQSNLGFMHRFGYGVKQDYAKAVRWYRKAADQGDTDAQESVTKLSVLLVSSSVSRSCAHCGVAETVGSVSLKPCGRCLVVFYCGKKCQTHGWKTGGHRADCK